MITGFNTNVRHRGLVFHVQTEDSGRANPHIISHVYHGGTIMASEKSEYADRVSATDAAGLGREVRVLMETQHKSMIARLERGEFDAAIAQRLPEAACWVQAPAESAPAAVQAAPVPPPTPQPAAGAQPERASQGFGNRVASERPLDEVILEYLVEKARKPRGQG